MTNILLKFVFFTSAFLFSISAHAFFGRPSVEIQSVSDVVEYGAMVPVNVILKNFSSKDYVTSVRIDVETNTETHRHVLTVEFPENPGDLRILTRARIGATQDGALIRAVAQTISGALYTKEFTTGKIKNPVDFDKIDTLLFAFNNPHSNLFSFRSNNLFESNIYYQERGDLKHVGGNFQHPALPPNLGQDDRILIGMKAFADDAPLYSIGFGSAIANDPYINVELNSSHSMASLKYIVIHGGGSVELKAKPRP